MWRFVLVISYTLLLLVFLLMGCGEEDYDSLTEGKIAFESNRDRNFEIYVMNADGSNPVNLTKFPSADDRAPCWSPDGTKIAFHSNPANLTRHIAFDSSPSWSHTR